MYKHVNIVIFTVCVYIISLHYSCVPQARSESAETPVQMKPRSSTHQHRLSRSQYNVRTWETQEKKNRAFGAVNRRHACIVFDLCLLVTIGFQHFVNVDWICVFPFYCIQSLYLREMLMYRYVYNKTLFHRPWRPGSSVVEKHES